MPVWLADVIAAGFVLRGVVVAFTGGDHFLAADERQRAMLRRIGVSQFRFALAWIATGVTVFLAARHFGH